MNTRKILIGTGVAATVLTGAIFTFSAVMPHAPSYAAGVVAQHANFGGHGGWHQGHGRGPGRGLAMICSDRRDQGIENGLAFVEGFVNFTPEQANAWSELSGAVRGESATIGETCEEMEKADPPQSAPEKLARAETLGAAGLGMLQRIRPVFERFYATLSDTQKQALDNLISHRGQRT